MKYGVSRSPLPSQLFLTANEKDFSLSLEMTMRGKGFAIGKAVFSLLPPEGGAPKGRGLASAADGKGMGRGVSSFRHPAMQDLRYPQCLSLTI